jgi:hypothetical protein
MKTRFLPLSSLLLAFLTFLLIFCATNVATAQVPSYVPTNGLVGYWPFNGNANDESGNGNNGTVNGATLAQDRFGNGQKAYDFVASANQSIGIGDFDLISNYSISVWYKLNSFGGWQNIVSKYGSSGGYAVIYDPSGALYSHTNNGTSFGDVCTSNYIETSNSWHMVTVTLGSGVFNFYVDGIAHGTCSNMNYSIPNDAITYFGRQSNGTGENLNGSLDDIGIWNRALTADEVLALYNGCNVAPIAIAGSNTPGAFLTSTYTCDNTAGSTYNWTVSNGVIASGQGTNSVSILWGAEGVGSVSVVETTADGCVGDTLIYDVNVQCVVSGNAITGSIGPEAFTNSTYTCNGAANSTYQWTITNGGIVSGQGTSSVTVLWASTGIGNLSVIETTAEGCVGSTLSQDVFVIPTNIEELSSALILYPNPVATNLTLQVKSAMIGSDFFVYDALGKVVLRDKILSTNQNISVNNLSNGNYILRVGAMNKVFTISK